MRASVRTGVGSRNRPDCLAHWSSARHWAITPWLSPVAAKSARTSAAAAAGLIPRSLLVSFSLAKIIPPHRLNRKPQSERAEHAKRVCSRQCSVSVGLEQQACLEDSACSFQPNSHLPPPSPDAATQRPEHGGMDQIGQSTWPASSDLRRYRLFFTRHLLLFTAARIAPLRRAPPTSSDSSPTPRSSSRCVQTTKPTPQS